jgi:hypothetical protein
VGRSVPLEAAAAHHPDHLDDVSVAQRGAPEFGPIEDSLVHLDRNCSGVDTELLEVGEQRHLRFQVDAAAVHP